MPRESIYHYPTDSEAQIQKDIDWNRQFINAAAIEYRKNHAQATPEASATPAAPPQPTPWPEYTPSAETSDPKIADPIEPEPTPVMPQVNLSSEAEAPVTGVESQTPAPEDEARAAYDKTMEFLMNWAASVKPPKPANKPQAPTTPPAPQSESKPEPPTVTKPQAEATSESTSPPEAPKTSPKPAPQQTAKPKPQTQKQRPAPASKRKTYEITDLPKRPPTVTNPAAQPQKPVIQLSAADIARQHDVVDADWTVMDPSEQPTQSDTNVIPQEYAELTPENEPVDAIIITDEPDSIENKTEQGNDDSDDKPDNDQPPEPAKTNGNSNRKGKWKGNQAELRAELARRRARNAEDRQLEREDQRGLTDDLFAMSNNVRYQRR